MGEIAMHPIGNRLDPWPKCRHSREGENPVYFGLHGYSSLDSRLRGNDGGGI